MGVDGTWITLIEPPLPGCDAHDKIFFNDTEVLKIKSQLQLFLF